jgi:hypothetical protein
MILWLCQRRDQKVEFNVRFLFLLIFLFFLGLGALTSSGFDFLIGFSNRTAETNENKPKATNKHFGDPF